MRSKKSGLAANDPLLTGREFRAELGISEPTFHRWRKAGRLPPPADLPGNPRWRQSVVEAAKGEMGQGSVIPDFGTEPAALAAMIDALSEDQWGEIVARRLGL